MSLPKFWMVIGDGPTSYRHTTLRDAIREAERLARLSPGTVFVVTEAVAAVEKNDVKWTRLDDMEHPCPDGEVPF